MSMENRDTEDSNSNKFLQLANNINLESEICLTSDNFYFGNSFSQEDTTNLNSYLAFYISAVLDDAIDKIQVINEGFSCDANINIESLREKALRYFADDRLFDPETGDSSEEAFRKKKHLKLHIDSARIIAILTLIKNELRDEGKFDTLTEFINDLKISKHQEKSLLIEEKVNFETMNVLRETLYTENRDNVKELQALNEKISIVKDQSEDILFQNLLRVRYVKDWEECRKEQGKLICNKQVFDLEETIKKYKLKIDREIAVNSEIETYLIQNQMEMEENIEQWIASYDKESESRIVEIQILKENREELEKELVALKILYENHKKEIDEYLAYKDQKRLEEERLTFLNAKATIIQAWWRGVMVRRKLGPYNPKKRSKGKKDKHKKAGKKKK